MSDAASSRTSRPAQFEAAIFDALDWLVDLVFPPRCGNCGRLDSRFCSGCLADLMALPAWIKRKPVRGLNACAAASGDHSGVLASAVRSFKYDEAVELSAPLSARLLFCLRRLPWRIDAIVPVPLHADRERERGYNQSSLLGERLAAGVRIGYEPDWLRRIRDTSQQARLDKWQRQLNVAEAFRASPAAAHRSALLVDDVLTTGATLGECARALQAQGAEAVYALTVSA